MHLHGRASKGAYVYASSHFCLNDLKYIPNQVAFSVTVNTNVMEKADAILRYESTIQPGINIMLLRLENALVYMMKGCNQTVEAFAESTCMDVKMHQ